ncbi:alpha/beta hydrolase family protein [Pseudomonas sp. N040]|uniref:alpha/beta hydrolase family protein n=1 Tax=Pseudomonas sp. N040 TaxID=2785325 RepID=UPI0018A2EB44|nr:alpha/beta hydrolase [Pseudomonas sp. N040]MBF7729723.1 alpha/beta hydrolase [Pseudomonas sp. N040]MBW7013365.1 hypothetical protein [Pseudomonas sp. N040]
MSDRALWRQWTLLLVLLIVLVPNALASDRLNLVRADNQSLAASVYLVDRQRCVGVAVISHGAGGSEAGYAYLAQVLAAQGWLALVPGHPESGREALGQLVRQSGVQKGLAQLIATPAAYQGRFMDIAAVRAWGQSHCDSSRSVLIGHSMGAATAMLEAGAKNHLGLTGNSRFDAYVALSPQGEGSIFPAQAWQEISMPVLMLTGTEDGELGGGSWKTRLQPFGDMPPGCKWLGVIEGASHMNFAGRGMSRRTEALTVQTIVSFLNSQPACIAPPAQKGLQLQTR